MRKELAQLTKKNIFIGTSSWKYPGWQGQIYHQTYQSDKEFNEKALIEYAQTFSAVGVDHTYYAWPTEKGMEKYIHQTPDSFQFGLKATEKISVFQYPKIRRYGKDAGTRNQNFLDANLFCDKFLSPLEKFKKRLGPIMFEFSHFYPGTLSSGSEFVEKLDTFLSALPAKLGFRFAIEIRNANWLQTPYFEVLEKHKVSHVFNSWTRMPTLSEQLEVAKKHELPNLIARILLQSGIQYAKAVESFSPYDKICSENPQLRLEAAGLIQHAIKKKIPAYVYVNNRAEGNAPLTIQGILSHL